MIIRVIGLGNVLMSDDGFGPYVARVLDACYEFPDGVEVVDAGTPGLDLTPYLLDTDVVLFVDTVGAEGPPGGLHTFWLADILAAGARVRLGPHDPGLADALLTVAAAGRGPKEVLLIGAIPARVHPGVGLTAAVEAAVLPVVLRVIDELQSRAPAPRPRPVPRPPDIWWERDGHRCHSIE